MAESTSASKPKDSVAAGSSRPVLSVRYHLLPDHLVIATYFGRLRRRAVERA